MPISESLPLLPLNASLAVSAKLTVGNGNGSGDADEVALVVAVAAAEVTEILGFKNFSLGDGKTYPTDVLRSMSQSSLSDDCRIICDSETAIIPYTRKTCVKYVTWFLGTRVPHQLQSLTAAGCLVS
ncbi:MAG: hypothetical protein AB2693_32535 [Candidatus Thiodiazotropha sp.]